MRTNHLSVLSVLVLSTPALAAPELRVLTDRTESHLKPIFEQYEKSSGVKIQVVFLDKGLIERMEGKPGEADLVITKDADLLAVAKSKKLLISFSSPKIETNVPAEFRDADKAFLVDAYRARVIFYSKTRVKPEMLSTYEDLANPKWKGKLCIRSGYHDYNLSLFGQMVTAWGVEKTKAIIAGWHANLAREPKGNDREQAKAIMEGKCDVALMNTYYHPIMMTTAEQKPWGEATEVFLPDQNGSGTFIMRSGAAIPKGSGNPKGATAFLEYLTGTEAQATMVNTTFQFPVNKATPRHELTRKFGVGQPEVKNGEFKGNFVSLEAIAGQRETVMKILNEVNFDKL